MDAPLQVREIEIGKRRTIIEAALHRNAFERQRQHRHSQARSLERQREGIAKAKAAGKYKGRPISIDAAQIRQLRAELGPAAIAKRLGIARSSVYRALA